MGEMVMRTVGMALVFGETEGDALSEYIFHVKTGQVEHGEKEFFRQPENSQAVFVYEIRRNHVRTHTLYTYIQSIYFIKSCLIKNQLRFTLVNIAFLLLVAPQQPRILQNWFR